MANRPGTRPGFVDEDEPAHMPHRRHAEGRPDFQDALAVLRLRKWSILTITILVMGLALFISSQQTPVYESESAVLVKPLIDPGTRESIPPNLATEEEILSSVAVAEIVAQNIEYEGKPRDLLLSLEVGSPDETEILEISYSHTSPAEARRGASGFAEGYLEYRLETVSEQLLQSAEAAQAELQVLRDRLNELEDDLDQLPPTDQRRGTLESEASLLQSLILQRQLDQLTLPEQIGVGNVVQPADLPDEPVSPNHVLNVGFGLVAGLALAIGLAFLRDRLSGRLSSNYELENQMGAPVLGSIPRISSWKKRKQAFLITREQWRAPESEAYRMLRTSVLSAVPSTESKSILVTSPHSGEGKTATVANLALALARAGIKVCVVSADLRRPRIHEFFATTPETGLSDVLQGRTPLHDALIAIKPPVLPLGSESLSLRFLPSGSVSEGPAELLGSRAMDEVIAELEATSDLVLIDSPPVLPVTDALVLAPKVSGVLLVVGPSSMTRATVSAARQQLDQVGAQIYGVVVNGSDLEGAQFRYAY